MFSCESHHSLLQLSTANSSLRYGGLVGSYLMDVLTQLYLS